MRRKKFAQFLTDVILRVLLVEDCLIIPKHHPTKRSRGEEDEPVVSLSDNDVMAGLDPSLRCMLVENDIENLEDKKKHVK